MAARDGESYQLIGVAIELVKWADKKPVVFAR